MKKILKKIKNNRGHWVGDGFPVRSMFNYNEHGEVVTPFLLMDYAGPYYFPPTTDKKGVGEHPHRGFETVTIVYDGEVEHRDSSGGGGIINKGDVQWMSAASGLVHEEFHGPEFAKTGGNFEMVQLWVNLPKKDKMKAPRYQGIKNDEIPKIKIGSTSSLRVIAGDYQETFGVAKTYSPINLWDLRISANEKISLKVPAGHTSALFVLNGEIDLESGDKMTDAEIAFFELDGETIEFSAQKDSKILFLGGEPIREPIVGHGPFVMNTQQEIMQAFYDFNSGKMGSLNKIEGSE